MSNELTLFELPKGALANVNAADDPLSDVLSGGAFTNRRISIKGNMFREYLNGKEVRVSKSRELNVVIVHAAPVSRTYFKGSYVEGQATAPVCWSADCQKPDPQVPADQRQASACKDCPQDIKGSGQGDSRACRFQQRIAIMLDGAIEDRAVYQLAIPATSLFGSDNKKMGLQAYARYLKAHNTPVNAIVTQLEFDTDSPTPKLMFKAVRGLTQAEYDVVQEMREHPDTIKAITFTVSQMDKVDSAGEGSSADEPFETPKALPATKVEKTAAKPVAKPAPVEEPVEEPKKVVSKKAVEVSEDKPDLKNIVDDWDD